MLNIILHINIYNKLYNIYNVNACAQICLIKTCCESCLPLFTSAQCFKINPFIEFLFCGFSFAKTSEKVYLF